MALSDHHALSMVAIVMVMMTVQLALCTLAICRLQREVRDLRNDRPLL